MAEILHKPSKPNPSLFGGDGLEDLFLLGFGVALTGGLNDNLTNPILAGLVPGGIGGDAGTKLVDAGTTWITAMGEGWAGSAIGFTHAARVVEKAGKALAVAKVATILLPGYSLNGKLPTFIQIPGAPGQAQVAAAPGVQQLPAGQVVGTGSSSGPPARPAVQGGAPGTRPMGL